MSGRSSAVKLRTLVRVLRDKGFILVRHNGTSHHIYTHPHVPGLCLRISTSHADGLDRNEVRNAERAIARATGRKEKIR